MAIYLQEGNEFDITKHQLTLNKLKLENMGHLKVNKILTSS